MPKRDKRNKTGDKKVHYYLEIWRWGIWYLVKKIFSMKTANMLHLTALSMFFIVLLKFIRYMYVEYFQPIILP